MSAKTRKKKKQIYRGCEFFRCDSCEHYKPIDQLHGVKALLNAYPRETTDEFRFLIFHIALCDKCFNE